MVQKKIAMYIRKRATVENLHGSFITVQFDVVRMAPSIGCLRRVCCQALV